MKKQKRIIPAILASVILLSFSGCKIADTTDKIPNGVTGAYESVEDFFTGDDFIMFGNFFKFSQSFVQGLAESAFFFFQNLQCVVAVSEDGVREGAIF